MSSPLIPPTSPQKGGDQDNSNDKPSGSATPHDTQIVPAGKVDTAAVLEIVGGFILGFSGIGLSDAGFHILGFLCDCAAVACGILLLHHYIKGKFKFARSLFYLLMFLNIAMFLFLSWHMIRKPETPPKPNILFGLTTSHSPREFLLISNAFLSTAAAVSSLPPTNPTVAIVTTNGEEQIDLEFEVINDPASAVELDDLKAIAVVPKETSIIIGPGWEGLNIINPNEIAKSQFTFSQKIPTKLFPGDNFAFGHIILPTTEAPGTFSGYLPMVFTFTSKGKTLCKIGFWLIVAKTSIDDPSIAPAPQLILGGGAPAYSNGVIRFVK